MPDYSKQLEDIAKALNRPTTPVWIIAAFSAFLGFISGIIAQSLMMLVTDFYRRYKMRRVLYLDLVNMFWAVDSIMAVTDMPQSERGHWQRDQLNKNLLFRGEKHCLDNPEIYVQLPERRAGELVYPYLHQILDDPNWLNVNTGLALRIFAHVVHDRTLKPIYFWLFLGRKGAAALRRSAEQYYGQDEELRKRIGLAPEEETKPNESLDDSHPSE